MPRLDALMLLGSRSFWRYLLKPKCDPWVPMWRVVWCRFNAHPCGPVFYNPGGLEPDMTCKTCGDNLG